MAQGHHRLLARQIPPRSSSARGAARVQAAARPSRFRTGHRPRRDERAARPGTDAYLADWRKADPVELEGDDRPRGRGHGGPGSRRTMTTAA